MSNVIEYNGTLIGYYSDLHKYLCKHIAERVQEEYWEEVKEMADLLLELNAWVSSECLLIIDEHNGMGYTISEYKKGE